MPKHSSYKKFTREVPVTLINGDTLTLAFNPAKVTPDLWRDATKDNATKTDTDFLVECASSWDWEDDNDKVIPITAKFLNSEVATEDRARMVTALIENMHPNESKASSDNSSSP